MRKILCLVAGFALYFLVSNLYSAENNLDGFALGINYPGVGIRYVRNAYGVEARFQALSNNETDESVSAAGLRFSRYFALSGRFYWYGGIEGDYLWYKQETADFSTNGWLAGAFIGIEAGLTKRFSLNLDFGPYYGKTSSYENTSSDIVDLAINTSINFRLGRVKKE